MKEALSAQRQAAATLIQTTLEQMERAVFANRRKREQADQSIGRSIISGA